MSKLMDKARERFLRLSHIDPVVGVPEIVQPDDVSEFVANVKTEFERRKEERRPFEMQWRLNQNFIAGNQYCDILESSGEVVDYPASFEWEMRTVYNQIGPIVETRLSKLSRVQPGLVVRPVTSDTEDIMSAKMSTKLLKSAYSSQSMNRLIAEANTWMETCGGVFYKNNWDTSRGLCLGSFKGKPVYEGDISPSVVPYHELFPSSCYVTSLEECDSIIHAKVYTVDEIRRRWGIAVPGRTMNTFAMEMSGMTSGGVGYNPSMMQVKDHNIDDAELVLEYYEKPNRDFPEGRHAIIIGDICVHFGVLPYKIGEHYRRGYPFVHQKCLDAPGVLWGASIVERCIPVQRDYNAVRNRINEYIARMTIGNMIVEQGSLVDDSILDTGVPPGTVIEYKPGSTPPQWMTPQEIPATLLTQVEQLQNEFILLSGVSELSRVSQTPSALSSGVALEILKEQDDTRLTLTSESVRESIRQVGVQWIRLYRQFVTVPRLTRIAGNNAGDVTSLAWKGSDLTSDDIIVDTDNEMTNTPAQRKQLALELLQVGLFSDPDTGKMTRETRPRLLEIFELGNWESAIDIDELHSVRAQREAFEFEAGKPPQIMDLDNHTLHISEHVKYALSADFRHLMDTDKAKAALWLDHISKHREIAVQRAMELSGQGGGQAASNVLNGAAPMEASAMADMQNGAMGGSK